MRRYLFDTGSAMDYINRRGATFTAGQARKRAGEQIGICMPVVGELWAGVECSASRQRNRGLLLRDITAFKLWPFDMAAAREYGRVHALQKSIGRLMGQIDMQIAAVAFTLGNCTVVTKDSDFAAIPGLAVEDWFGP